VARPSLRDIPTEPPSQWTGTDVRLLRRHLRVSQTTFARILGVKKKLSKKDPPAAD
jgi:DNA-binding transcriptional regulator YiaG